MGELKGTVVGEGFLMMFSRQEQTEVNNRRGAMREPCALAGAAREITCTKSSQCRYFVRCKAAFLLPFGVWPGQIACRSDGNVAPCLDRSSQNRYRSQVPAPLPTYMYILVGRKNAIGRERAFTIEIGERARERERERERDRQTDRQTDRHRQTDRQTETETQTDRAGNTNRQTEKGAV